MTFSFAISQLKLHKSDASGITNEHLKFASPVIYNHLSLLFTSILCHALCRRVFVTQFLYTFLKVATRDASDSSNYRSIALSLALKDQCSQITSLSSLPVPFCFNPGYSTSLCTANVKKVISRYIHNGSPILGCLLHVSKAFYHGILFQKLLDRGLSLAITQFLISWYGTQKMRVRWVCCFSEPFSVCNGVRQGSVLSPLFFTV